MRVRRQQALDFPGRGGRRPGAGRKPAGPRPRVSHQRRPSHDRRHPAHVTLRAVDDLPSLRGGNVFPALRRAFGAACARAFRVVHYSVQGNHLHLLVEADDERALTRGMQGLCIRLARAVNRILGRHGRVWSDRFHARALRTPREVRNALVYVLLNGRKHAVSGRGVDPCSSGPWFAGWRDPVGQPPTAPPVAPAQTWLLSVGWRRSGEIRIDMIPGRLRRGDAR